MEQSASKEEVIGYHKGSLNTLIAERNELLRLVQITESLIQAHAKELEGLGIKLQSSSSPQASSSKASKK